MKRGLLRFATSMHYVFICILQCSGFSETHLVSEVYLRKEKKERLLCDYICVISDIKSVILGILVFLDFNFVCFFHA